MIGSQNIRDIFSIFHDGVIIQHQYRERELSLVIDIMYLAERIASGFTKFEVILSGVENIKFTTWPNDVTSDSQTILDRDAIFRPELEILSASAKNNLIQIACNQSSSNFEYCGGELLFSAELAKVTDEAGKAYTIEELRSLSKGYWDDWKQPQS